MIPPRPYQTHHDDDEYGGHTLEYVEHIEGVADKAVRTLRRIAETHNNDSITWIDLYDMVCDALDEIVDSGWGQ